MKIDAYCLAFDETQGYAIAEADRPLIAQIQSVYLLDRNQRTHLCEITPSYYLTHLYDTVVAVDGVGDEERDRLDSEYAHEASDDKYVHCHEIDWIIEARDRGVVYHYGDPEVPDDEDKTDEENHDAQMEALREHFCGNCPL